MTTQTIIAASDKQVSFVRTLMAERDFTSLQVGNIIDAVEGGNLSKTDAVGTLTMK